MPVITRSMTKKMAMAEVVHQQPSEPSPSPSITDLPPEVLEIILRNLDCGKNSILPYRLVSPLWKSNIDDLLEKKTLKGDVDGCPTLRTSTGWPNIRCPSEMLLPNWNPFPSSSLTITRRSFSSDLGRYPPFRYNRSFRLDNFMSKVGTHLTTFILKSVSFNSTENLCKTLAHLPNLKILNLRSIDIVNMGDEETLGFLPVLPHLSTLEIYSFDGNWNWKNQTFCAWFVGTYAEQLEYLYLTLATSGEQVHPLPLRPPSSLENSPMQKLRQLNISYADAKFLQLSCSPPFLKHLYIGTLQYSEEMTLAVLMDFVDKFSDTLETLDLDIAWSELSRRQNRDGEGDGNQLDKMLKRFFGEDAIRNGDRLSDSTAAPVFPKLTNLTFPYPSDVVESTVISKMMLPKFPALRELKLGYSVQLNHHLNENDFRERYGPQIKTLLIEEDYWKLCSKLILVSVWHTGEGFIPVMCSDRPNFRVVSVRRGDYEK